MGKKIKFDLGDFQTVMPRHIAAQTDTLNWMAEAHARAAAITATDGGMTPERVRERFQRFGCKPTQIAARGFDTVDVTSHDFSTSGLYALGRNRDTGVTTSPSSSQLGERSRFFLTRSVEVFDELYPPSNSVAAAPSVDQDAPDHIIHVTCTGYLSPSAPQRLVDARSWHEKTAVTHAYHMGCYASLPAIRMAEGLSLGLAARGQKSPRVDIVHTEICTLHMNPSAHGPDQMVIQSLFADGHIKYSVAPANSLKRGFGVLAVAEQILKDSAEDMTWTPTEWGFAMGLSRDVPEKIGANLRDFLVRLAREADCDLGELLKTAQFAIHPGGPRIIGAVQKILELSDAQTAHSKKVLLDRGNMSSATLPHVWAAMDASSLPSGSRVVSLAFGPGLTIFGAVFVVI